MRGEAEFRIRVSEEMRADIIRRAKDNGRSLNSEIVNLIAAGLAASGDGSSGQAEDVDKLKKDVRRILRHLGLK